MRHLFAQRPFPEQIREAHPSLFHRWILDTLRRSTHFGKLTEVVARTKIAKNGEQNQCQPSCKMAKLCLHENRLTNPRIFHHFLLFYSQTGRFGIAEMRLGILFVPQGDVNRLVTLAIPQWSEQPNFALDTKLWQTNLLGRANLPRRGRRVLF
jgi:hypothetical protein